MLSRAELVALSIAILAAAAGAFGGEVVGFILLGAVLFIALLLVSGLGERIGLAARPRVRFLEPEVTGSRQLPEAWLNSQGVFVTVPVVTESGPDVALYAEFGFTSTEGEPLLDGRRFRARWSNSDEEGFALEWPWIDFAKSEISILKAKFDKPRTVLLLDEAAEALRSMPRRTDKHRQVFRSRAGCHSDTQRRTTTPGIRSGPRSGRPCPRIAAGRSWTSTGTRCGTSAGGTST